jgi:hypothetical protein
MWTEGRIALDYKRVSGIIKELNIQKITDVENLYSTNAFLKNHISNSLLPTKNPMHWNIIIKHKLKLN